MQNTNQESTQKNIQQQGWLVSMRGSTTLPLNSAQMQELYGKNVTINRQQIDILNKYIFEPAQEEQKQALAQKSQDAKKQEFYILHLADNSQIKLQLTREGKEMLNFTQEFLPSAQSLLPVNGDQLIQQIQQKIKVKSNGKIDQQLIDLFCQHNIKKRIGLYQKIWNIFQRIQKNQLRSRNIEFQENNDYQSFQKVQQIRKNTINNMQSRNNTAENYRSQEAYNEQKFYEYSSRKDRFRNQKQLPQMNKTETERSKQSAQIKNPAQQSLSMIDLLTNRSIKSNMSNMIIYQELLDCNSQLKNYYQQQSALKNIEQEKLQKINLYVKNSQKKETKSLKIASQSIEEKIWKAQKFRQREKEILNRYWDDKNRSEIESFKNYKNSLQFLKANISQENILQNKSQTQSQEKVQKSVIQEKKSENQYQSSLMQQLRTNRSVENLPEIQKNNFIDAQISLSKCVLKQAEAQNRKIKHMNEQIQKINMQNRKAMEISLEKAQNIDKDSKMDIKQLETWRNILAKQKKSKKFFERNQDQKMFEIEKRKDQYMQKLTQIQLINKEKERENKRQKDQIYLSIKENSINRESHNTSVISTKNFADQLKRNEIQERLQTLKQYKMQIYKKALIDKQIEIKERIDLKKEIIKTHSDMNQLKNRLIKGFITQKEAE